jgi:hypothetical protein
MIDITITKNEPVTYLNRSLIDSLPNIVVINEYAECFRECVLKNKRDNCIHSRYYRVWNLEMMKRNLINDFNVIYDNSYKQTNYVDNNGRTWITQETIWEELEEELKSI